MAKTSFIAISDRGQVTIPKNIRKKVPAQLFVCYLSDSNIVLQPAQTRDEFLEELEEARLDWEKHGGLTVKQMKKKYNIK